MILILNDINIYLYNANTCLITVDNFVILTSVLYSYLYDTDTCLILILSDTDACVILILFTNIRVMEVYRQRLWRWI